MKSGLYVDPITHKILWKNLGLQLIAWWIIVIISKFVSVAIQFLINYPL